MKKFVLVILISLIALQIQATESNAESADYIPDMPASNVELSPTTPIGTITPLESVVISECNFEINSNYESHYFILENHIYCEEGDYGIKILDDYTNIDCQNYKIQGNGSYGIKIDSAEHTTIKNCIISNFENGVYIYNTSGTDIENNNIYDNSGYGIKIKKSSNNSFENNVIFNNLVGLYFYDESNSNQIEGNIINYNYEKGLQTNNATEMHASNNQLCFNQVEEGNLYVEYGSNILGSSNQIETYYSDSSSTVELSDSTLCPEITCFDQIDNDEDGLIDCEDSDCEDLQCGYYEGSACSNGVCTELYCNDGIDNDLMIELIESNESEVNTGTPISSSSGSTSSSSGSGSGTMDALDYKWTDQSGTTTTTTSDGRDSFEANSGSQDTTTDNGPDQDIKGTEIPTEQERMYQNDFADYLNQEPNFNDAIDAYMLDNLAVDKSNAGELWSAIWAGLQEEFGFNNLQIEQIMLTKGVTKAGVAATSFNMGVSAEEINSNLDTLSNQEYQGRRAQAWVDQGKSQTEIAEALILQGATEEEAVQAMTQTGMEQAAVEEVVQQAAVEIAQVQELAMTEGVMDSSKQQFGFAGFAIHTGEADGGWILKSFNWIRSLFGSNVAGQAYQSELEQEITNNIQIDNYYQALGFELGTNYNFSESDGPDCSDSDCSYASCGDNKICYERSCIAIEYNPPTVTVETEEVSYFTTYEDVLSYLNSCRVFKNTGYSEISSTYNGICEDFCNGKGMSCIFSDGGMKTCQDTESTICTCC